MTSGFEYVFPAIRGIQAGQEYYVSMCPLRLLPKIFLFNEAEMLPELRAQRQLNRARVPEIAKYMNNNPRNYIFSAITASIDADVRFEKSVQDDEGGRIGILKIPMSARFVINDGQHRRAAIEMALQKKPELGDETIAVVFFLDVGLERSQQMFVDLNKYAIRPSASLNVLYDHRSDKAQLARRLVESSNFLKEVVELEKASLSERSKKLFTLSAIHKATSALISDVEFKNDSERDKTVLDFWNEVANNLKEWRLVQSGTVSTGDIRRDFIHSHGVVLQAMGRVGNALLRKKDSDWKKTLKKISKIDWRRSNSSLWEGRAMIGGHVSKTHQNVTLTTNAIKNFLGLDLGPEERRAEDAFKRERSTKKAA